MSVRRLTPADAHYYRALMLDAYRHHPESFTSTFDERAALPYSWWESRLSVALDAREVVLGAYAGDALVGAVGVEFEQRAKARHKAFVFGMYVAPAARRAGVAARLLDAALGTARARPGIGLAQLTVSGGNHAARALYERAGFVVFGDEPYAIAIDGGYLAKLHMWRDLGVARGG
ncbi:MAG: GNAT family protein [Burkholderiales bacterium]